MSTFPLRRTGIVLLTAALLAASTGMTQAQAVRPRPARSNHVLLLSVDGLHQSDLSWYVAQHPRSALAALVRGGVDYTAASTPVPSDSFPGMVAQVTGGNPRTTGVYYDDTFNRSLFPAGTTSCKGRAPGAEVNYTEGLDLDPASIDAGQGLAGLPGSIMSLTSQPRRLIDPTLLPVDPSSCRPVYPHSYLKVNTVFNVARDHGLRTAWSDKHPAYDILQGPSGNGIQDLFTPEINSDAIGFPAGNDWTTDNAATRQYDGYKVQAVLNEIDGYDHSRSRRVGEPAIFGMNFQAVSTAQKLPTSDGLTGGYLPGGTVPGPLLSGALDFVDKSLGAMTAELYAQGRAADTTIILSAKHGQSPTDPADLVRVPDQPIIDAINAGWQQAHPQAKTLIAFAVDDDLLQFWLSDRSTAATSYVRRYLLGHSAAGNTIDGHAVTIASSGLRSVRAGVGAARYFHVNVSDPRHADVVGTVNHGVVFTGGTKKIAEHGGSDPQDRSVPIVIAGPDVRHGKLVRARVETTQIAPTILRLLGLRPAALQAVRAEHTRTLPGLLRVGGH